MQRADEGLHRRAHWNRGCHSRWRAESEVERLRLHMCAKDGMTVFERGHTVKPCSRAPSQSGNSAQARRDRERTGSVGFHRASRREPLWSSGRRSGGVPPLLGRQPGRGSTAALEECHVQVCSAARVRPNPSLKRSANGRPPGPVWRYTVHFRQPGPGVLPSSPA